MSSSKVLDIALKYGYDSPESFSKAFRKIHGITPSEARNSGVSLKAFPRISFHLSLKGDKDVDFSYMIASKADVTSPAEGFALSTIPATTWAIFTSVGSIPGAIQNMFGRIYQEWFPATGYEHSGAPEMEVYLPGDITAEDYRCEVWIPIVKK
jgi:predicted transcriptional regulator YdeE